MSVKSLRQAADNRKAVNTQTIDRAVSPYEKLRHAVEWVMSEARAMDRAEVPALVDRITRVAHDLNERSRP